jgi:hypothetical protein
MYPKIPQAENEKYFKTRMGCLWVFGVGVAMVGLPFLADGGWIMLLVGLGLVVAHFAHTPSGPESVDASRKMITDFAREAAGVKLGLDVGSQQLPPIVVSGFSRAKTGQAGPVHAKASEQGLRTSVVSAFVAFFGPSQVHIYTLDASLTEPGARVEKTVEFFYSDVVSLATETDSSGTRLTLTVSDGSKYECPAKEASDLDSEVRAARELIRAKRE